MDAHIASHSESPDTEAQYHRLRIALVIHSRNRAFTDSCRDHAALASTSNFDELTPQNRIGSRNLRAVARPAEQDLLARIWANATCSDNILITLGPTLGHHEIKVEENSGQDELDLVGGEEASGAGIPPKPKVEVFLGHGHELILLWALVPYRVLVLSAADAREPVRVEGLEQVTKKSANVGESCKNERS